MKSHKSHASMLAEECVRCGCLHGMRLLIYLVCSQLANRGFPALELPKGDSHGAVLCALVRSGVELSLLPLDV